MCNKETETNNKKIMKTFIYLNHNNLVVYCDYKDSAINSYNTNLQRFVIDSEYLQLFIKYYQLRLHKLALNNIVY